MNTASRIEAMTKGTLHSVLMAESTVESLTVSDGVSFVGEFEARGRQSAIRLWTLAGTKSAAAGARAGEMSAKSA